MFEIRVSIEGESTGLSENESMWGDAAYRLVDAQMSRR